MFSVERVETVAENFEMDTLSCISRKTSIFINRDKYLAKYKASPKNLIQNPTVFHSLSGLVQKFFAKLKR